MPAKSKSQQRLMALAYALKTGEMKPEDASQQVKDLADSMTVKQLKDYASTKTKDLPQKVDEWVPGVSAGHKWYTQSAQSAISYGTYVKDLRDPLIKNFLKFIEGEEEKDLKENGQATTVNTTGMCNVQLPTEDSVGSGDIYGNEKKKRKKDKNILSFVTFIQRSISN